MPTTQEDFDALETALKNNSIEDLKKILHDFDLAANGNFRRNCLMHGCLFSRSPEAMKVILEKIEETGGPDLLKSQFTATDNDDRNCLMHCCINSKSPEVVKVIIEKIEQTDVPDLLKSLLAATDINGWNCLMLCSGWSKSPEVVKVVLEKIEETGGPDLLKRLVAATDDDGRNCLMLCGYSSSSPEVVKVILEKIEETGGPDLLKSLLTATNNDGWNCLMLCGAFSKSPEVVKDILKKIEETGGPDLLKRLVAATDDDGRNCLMLCGMYSSSPLVVKLVLENIDETGDPHLLKSLLTATDSDGKNCLTVCGVFSKSPEVVKVILQKFDETGGPDLFKSLLVATSNGGQTCLMLYGRSSDSPEVVKLFAAVLFHVDLFREQFAKLDDYDKNKLKEKTGIDSSSWAPDAASLAEVKATLQGADPAAAEKKAEEDAAAKKKADEEAAAKKKAEDESAAKKSAEDEAAAKKKSEEETAAKKKAEEEAAAKKKADEEAAAAKTKPDDRPSDGSVSTDAPPPSLCFRRGVPAKSFKDATNSLLSIKEAPENRPDLDDWIPDKHDRDALLLYLDRALPELKSRPAVQKLIAECSLTDDDIKILHSYKIESPYPVFRWLNGWLGGDRRDEFVKENVAPFFTLLYRAMEKLPRVPASANRGVKINGIPALKHTYDNHKVVCATDNTLAFWGFCSFSTEDGVVNREEFVGKPDEEGIVYSCGKLEGVNMEPFKPKGLKDEAEVLPLCPCVFRVASCFKAGKKLIVGVEQLNHSEFSYVLPRQ